MHGKGTTEFIKLIDKVAPEHQGDVLLKLAASMGPADDPNPKVPAGWTYFGQFVDHDITKNTEEDKNSRTPFFDLDSVYGDGPDRPGKPSQHGAFFTGEIEMETFKIGHEGNERHTGNKDGDLNRNSEFVAQIPEARNDENIIIASLQLLFQKFHNKLINEEGLSFAIAKRIVQWHYQSIVRNDYLPKIVGEDRIKKILDNGHKVYNPTTVAAALMPTEYAGACFRFGHSMVREEYNFNDVFSNTPSNPNLFWGFPDGKPIEALQNDPSIDPTEVETDLTRVIADHQITEIWSLQGNGNTLLRFFDPNFVNTRRNPADNLSGKFDTKLASILFNIEVKKGQNNVLAHMNLLSGQRLNLPNGQQTVAALKSKGVVGITELTRGQILNTGAPEAIGNNTPLWYYVLKEAEVQKNGETLGDVGGTIVAETILALLKLDVTSFEHSSLPWEVNLSTSETKEITMVELINYVSKDPVANSASE